MSKKQSTSTYKFSGRSRGGAQGGGGGGLPPLIFRSNWGPKSRKNFWDTPPSVSKGLDNHPPLSQGLDLALKFSKLILIHFLEELVERIWWKTKAFSSGALFFILITFLLEDVLMLLVQNWCWSLWDLNGYLFLKLSRIMGTNIFPQNSFFP